MRTTRSKQSTTTTETIPTSSIPHGARIPTAHLANPRAPRHTTAPGLPAAKPRLQPPNLLVLVLNLALAVAAQAPLLVVHGAQLGAHAVIVEAVHGDDVVAGARLEVAHALLQLRVLLPQRANLARGLAPRALHVLDALVGRGQLARRGLLLGGELVLGELHRGSLRCVHVGGLDLFVEVLELALLGRRRFETRHCAGELLFDVPQNFDSAVALGLERGAVVGGFSVLGLESPDSVCIVFDFLAFLVQCNLQLANLSNGLVDFSTIFDPVARNTHKVDQGFELLNRHLSETAFYANIRTQVFLQRLAELNLVSGG